MITSLLLFISAASAGSPVIWNGAKAKVLPAMLDVGGLTGLGGSPKLGNATTGDLTEGSNQYFTTGRAQAAISCSSPLSISAGNISLPAATSSVDGYLGHADFATFNGAFHLPGLTSGSVISSNGTTLIEDNSNLFWDNTAKRFYIGSNPTASPADNGQLNLEQQSSGTTDHALNVIARGSNNAIEIQAQQANVMELSMNANSAAGGAAVTLERARGTVTNKTQMKAGDVYGGIFFQGYTGSAFVGYGAYIAAVAVEDITSSRSGSEILFGTSAVGANNVAQTPLILDYANNAEFGGQVLANGAVAGTNTALVAKNGHQKSTQTTAPTVLVEASAGTGASCTIANGTDVAGQVTVATGTIGVSTGSYCTLTFNKAYGVAPICVLTPAGSTLSTSVYVTSATTTFDINFALAGGAASTYVLNYNCIETQ